MYNEQDAASFHFKLLEEQGTWVTPSQEVQAIKVSTCNRTDQIIRAQVQKQAPKRSNFQT
jgi:hypothetical protein